MFNNRTTSKRNHKTSMKCCIMTKGKIIITAVNGCASTVVAFCKAKWMLLMLTFFAMDTCGLKAFFKHQTHHPTKWDTVLKNIFFIFVSIYFSIGMTSIHFGIRHKDNIFWCQCTYLTT